MKTPALEAAYRATTYILCLFDREIDLRIGAMSPEMDEFLDQLGVSCLVCMTAENPRSKLLEREDNIHRNKALKRQLTEAGLKYFPGFAKSLDGEWPTENMLWVPGLSTKRAKCLGVDYQQNAVVYVCHRQRAKLLWCSEK